MSEIGATSANAIRGDYLNLLITQLRNQNPLDPMDNDQMAAQLAQLSQLEQLENMNSTLMGQSSKFDLLLKAQNAEQATQMIGKEVAFFPEGSTMAAYGVVDRVDVMSGEPTLVVAKPIQIVDGVAKPLEGDYAVGVEAVQSIRDPR